MSEQNLRGSRTVPERGGEGFLTHAAEKALHVECDRLRAALENIAVGQYPGQFKHEADPVSAYAHAVLEAPADA